MLSRTKIIATLGPSTGSTEIICELARAGASVFRVNFSHGDRASHAAALASVRAAEKTLGYPVAVIADLSGPKIRVGEIALGAVLVKGGVFSFQREHITGNGERASCSLPSFVDEVQPGEAVLLDDGKLRLKVEEVLADEVRCRVIVGGPLSSRKGVNLPDTDLTLSALTDKDRTDAAWIAGQDFDFVALSFVRRAADVRALRVLLRSADCFAHIIAKIEKPQAVANIEAIIKATDGIMVARGDLGVEMNLAGVPVAQKRIAALCEAAGKPCIIATQMLESMTTAATPTRAEVSDVANAVLDRVDAIMLSGETAVGAHPVAAVEVMRDVALEVERYHDEVAADHVGGNSEYPTLGALAEALPGILRLDRVVAVAVFTASGMAARLLAKVRLDRPVLVISPNIQTIRRTGLYYGVRARLVEHTPQHTRGALEVAGEFAQELGLATQGDKLVVLSGRPLGEAGTINTLVVHEVC